MKRYLLLIPLVLASVFCSIDFSSAGSPTPDVAQMVSTTLTALAAQAPATEAAAPTAEPTQAVIIPTAQPTAAPAIGTVSGNLMYPSSFVPALRIVAFPVLGGAPVIVTTVDGQSTYEMQLPAGQYYIVAYTLDGAFSGGYTVAVPCGLSVDCPDHSLLVVTVMAGQVTTNIVPGDFYAPDGAFPPMP